MEITLLNLTVHKLFDNYLFPDLPDYIIHRIENNPGLESKYFKEHITPEYILRYMSKSEDLINNEITEDLIIKKLIEIVEEGNINA